MTLNFQAALDSLGPGFAARISREGRAPAEYHLAMLLPEQARNTYSVDAANMTVVPTMAGLTAMDSPYAPVGQVKLSTFLEKTAKITSKAKLSEEAQRELQAIATRLAASGASSSEAMAAEVLGFQSVILQAHFDTAEYLRGQALFNGAIDWTYGVQRVQVDYGVPAANKLTTRTGTAAYDGADTEFWADVREAQRLARYNVAEVIAHIDTLQAVIGNEANGIEVTAQDGNYFTLSRLVGANDRRSTDARDSLRVYGYGLEGSVIDPEDPTQTVDVPFVPKGKILFVGRAARPAYRVGQGAQVPVTDSLAVGYHHIAPTVEGGGMPGRWSRVYSPEQTPYQLFGEGVGNELPVIESPQKLVILSTEIGGA